MAEVALADALGSSVRPGVGVGVEGLPPHPGLDFPAPLFALTDEPLASFAAFHGSRNRTLIERVLGS